MDITLLPPANPDADGAVGGEGVLQLLLLELVAPDPSSDRTEGGAELVPAPHQPVPHVPQVVARPEASQSLPAPRAEPVESLFQSGSAGTDPFHLQLSRLAVILVLLMSLCQGLDFISVKACNL